VSYAVVGGTSEAARNLTEGVQQIASGTGKVIQQTGEAVSQGVHQAASTTADTIQQTGDATSQAIHDAAQSTQSATEDFSQSVAERGEPAKSIAADTDLERSSFEEESIESPYIPSMSETGEDVEMRIYEGSDRQSY
jgi:ElaB/YqjD/DUF883 family membrane-anchored ribosome-binding protein